MEKCNSEINKCTNRQPEQMDSAICQNRLAKILTLILDVHGQPHYQFDHGEV